MIEGATADLGAAGTREIAEAVDCSVDTASRRLDAMEDEGRSSVGS